MAACQTVSRIRFLTRNALMMVDETGEVPLTTPEAKLFFQLVNARHSKTFRRRGAGTHLSGEDSYHGLAKRPGSARYGNGRDDDG